MSRGYSGIGLYCPKFYENVGGALRAAGCYASSFVAYSGMMEYDGASTDTMKIHRHMPLFKVENILDVTPFDCKRVAIEIHPDAESLPYFKHPERGYYIFGPEGGSLPEDVVEKCDHIVQIPTIRCMNLAATVNVVLYDRLLKLSQEQ